MKGLAIAFFLLMGVSVNVASACEICGCGVGNFYLGVVPKFNSAFVGMRYRYTQYRTSMNGAPSEYSKDYYSTIELWGGWNVTKNFQFMMFVPYQINSQFTDDGNKFNSGIGDITILTNYKIWGQRKLTGSNKLIEQQIWVGVGAKLPSGKSVLDVKNPDFNIGDANAQTGTGSVDLLLSASHYLYMGNWGLNTSVNYKVNSTNKYGYQFGNRVSVNELVYYRFDIGSLRIAPVVGLSYEKANINYFNKERVEMTGGYAILASTGIEINRNKVAIGATVQSPVSQNFADHQTLLKPRIVTHVTFTF